MKNPESTKHGRCEATNRKGKQCGRAAIDNRGKCGYHGGKTPLKNGIFSDVVREEDQAVMDALGDLSTAKKLDETLNLQVMKLRRAVALLDDPDREADFWGLFEDLVDGLSQDEGPDRGQIQELAQLLDTPHQAQRDLMENIRKAAKTLHDITEGQDINVSHDVDTEAISELKELASDAYDG